MADLVIYINDSPEEVVSAQGAPIVPVGGGGMPSAHAGSHTDGTDDIRDATSSQKGLATEAHIAAIEANTAKISADGSVTTHDDITSAGSGQITTTAERVAWNGKQDALTFDSVPTDGSANPVESNGVYDAVQIVQTGLDTHVADTENPHTVTAEQAGADPAGTAAAAVAAHAIGVGVHAVSAVTGLQESLDSGLIVHNFTIREVIVPTDTATVNDRYLSLNTSSNDVALTLPESDTLVLYIRHDYNSTGDNTATITNQVSSEPGPWVLEKGNWICLSFDGSEWMRNF